MAHGRLFIARRKKNSRQILPSIYHEYPDDDYYEFLFLRTVERGIVASAAQNTPHMEMFFLIFWHQPQYMEMFFASSTTFRNNRVILTYLFRFNTT